MTTIDVERDVAPAHTDDTIPTRAQLEAVAGLQLREIETVEDHVRRLLAVVASGPYCKCRSASTPTYQSMYPNSSSINPIAASRFAVRSTPG